MGTRHPQTLAPHFQLSEFLLPPSDLPSLLLLPFSGSKGGRKCIALSLYRTQLMSGAKNFLVLLFILLTEMESKKCIYFSTETHLNSVRRHKFSKVEKVHSFPTCMYTGARKITPFPAILQVMAHLRRRKKRKRRLEMREESRRKSLLRHRISELNCLENSFFPSSLGSHHRQHI